MPRNPVYVEMPTRPTPAQAELLELLRSLYRSQPSQHKAVMQAIDKHARAEYGRGYFDGAAAQARLP